MALASSKMAPISLEASLPFGAPKSKKKEKEKKRERERDKSKKKRKKKKEKDKRRFEKVKRTANVVGCTFFYSLSPPFYLVVSFCSSFVLLLLPSTASIFHLIVRVVAAYWLATLYRVLPGFHQLNIATRNQPHLSLTVFHWVLLGFTGFSWVITSFTGFYLALLGFYWVLPSFTGFYLVLLGFTGFSWVFMGSTELYLVLLGFT